MKPKLHLGIMFMLLLSSTVNGIDIENVSIGTGSYTCYSFAIIADPQSSTSKLAQAVNWVNINHEIRNIKFVIVLGDLIQGEKAYDNDYDAEFSAVEAQLNNLVVPWIPMIGNHDVWCNLEAAYAGTSYPEGLFDSHFRPVYGSLSNTLAGWVKQEEMPINPNPNNPTYPPTYFQNFAFDYGDYHFVCLDFCARDDFEPDDLKIRTNLGGEVTIPDYRFGYARIQEEYGNAGTIKWLEDHLAGYKRSKKIILLSHHAPVFNLSVTASSGMITLELPDENSYGFNSTEYISLVALLNGLSTEHDFNYQWFAGHYHEKDMNWIETDINPDTPVKVIASANPLSLMSKVDEYLALLPGNPTRDPKIKINNAYSVIPADNLNGRITIVDVLSGSTGPDPSIYSQWDPEVSQPVVWDNPDIELYDLHGNFVPSSSLNFGKYKIWAKIYNKGCNNSTINVSFTWSKEALNYADQVNGFTDGAGPNQNIINNIVVPAGKEVVIGRDTPTVTWNTEKVPSSLSDLMAVHACVKVEIEPITLGDDSNPNNNVGQENCVVYPAVEPDDAITYSIPITNFTGIAVNASSVRGRLWNLSIDLWIDGRNGVAELRFTPNRSESRPIGASEKFSLTASKDGKITGGLDVNLVVDDPPILNWAGSSGYTTDGVEPDEGNAGTTFAFKVKYEDKNDDPPASSYPLLYLFKGGKQIEDSPFVMSEESPADTTYSDGKIYTYSIALSESGNDYAYRFWARDALLIGAEGPATNVISGPKVVCEKMTEVEYKNLLTAPIDVDQIKLVYNAANGKWVKSSSNKPYAKILMYWDRKTGYLITLRVNSEGCVENVDFSRRGDKTIKEITCELADKSLAILPQKGGMCA